MAGQQAKNRLILHKTVVLVGMMGAGKTAVGRTLAGQLGVPFRDSDAEIVTAAAMPIAEIFDRDGEPFFRAREAQVITRLLDDTPCILSTGGGAFLQAQNRETISDRGVSVWLDADLDLLWSRVRHKDTRPLLRTDNPFATLRELFEARVPTYALADLSVKAATNLTLDAMARRVAETVADQRPDVLERNDD